MNTRLLLYMLAGSSIPIHTYGQQWENNRPLDSIQPPYTPQEIYELSLKYEADQYERRNSQKTHNNAGPGIAQNSHAKTSPTTSRVSTIEDLTENTGAYHKSSQHVPTNSESTSQAGNNYNYDSIPIDQPSGTYDAQKPVRPPQLGPKPSQLALPTMNCGIKMMQQLGHERQGNSVISPLSIVVALSTIQQGAYTQTGVELAKFLQSGAETSRERIRNFKTNAKIASQGNILKIANGVFVSDAFTLNNDFKTFAVKNFGADVVSLNFRQPLNATNEINRWFRKSTRDLTPILVDSRGLNPATQLFLARAVFFKGIWNTTKTTRQHDFTVESGRDQTVEFMTQIGQFRAGDNADLNAKWLFLPFLNEEFNMLFLLPNEKFGLDRMLNSLTEAALERMLRNSTYTKVAMEIPKFKLSFETDMVNILVQLGLHSIFTPAADLRGVGSSLGNETLYVSKILHKVTIEIDEQGIIPREKPVVTFSNLSLDSYYEEFHFMANHPFLVILFDTNLSTPLIMARIIDPGYNQL